MQKNSKRKIFVSVPSLAPIDEYISYLKEIWNSKILTHNGPLVQKLEFRLKEYLKIK